MKLQLPACNAFAVRMLFGSWAIVATAPWAVADALPAHFWLSTSSQSTSGPVAPTINLDRLATQTIYIWGQPGTDVAGNFKELQNLSLNVVSDLPALDILNNFQVFDPLDGTGKPRFEVVRDSDTAPTNVSSMSSDRYRQLIESGQPDSITGMSGGVVQTSLYTGFGLSQQGNNGVASGSGRAWLIGSFSVFGLSTSGTSHIYLQVGDLGMNHAGEFSQDTSVVFGAGADPVYNAKSNRDTTFAGDSADLTVNSLPTVKGDLDSDGKLTNADIQALISAINNQTSFKNSNNLLDSDLIALADLNGDNSVNRFDLDPLLLKLIGQNPFDLPLTVPEPSAIVLAAIGGCVLTGRRRNRLRRTKRFSG
ncbi:MAG TPA: dockerin type I domain-containing protein [Pirellulales bacterium]|jgi:hypothetical protein